MTWTTQIMKMLVQTTTLKLKSGSVLSQWVKLCQFTRLKDQIIVYLRIQRSFYDDSTNSMSIDSTELENSCLIL